MKCSACGRDIGYHEPTKDKNGKVEPAIIRCPNTGRLAEASA